MQMLTELEPGEATGKVKDIFARVTQIMGRVPKMMRLMGNSPAAAEAYLRFNLSLSEATLSAQTRTLIAATVAEADNCEYSRLIARAQALNSGVSEEALHAATRAVSSDAKVTLALQFARALVEQRGRVQPSTVAELRVAGYGDGEIVEIVAVVILGIFRNYFNLVAGTEIDAPPPRPAD